MADTVLILGGGIIGLASAFEAAGRGYRVTVLEAEAPGGQASGAAAGMLAPFSENPDQPDDFFRLCLDSLRRYPEWLASIEAASGTPIEWQSSGSLNIAYHEADLEPLRTRMDWHNRFGAEAELVDAALLRKLEPALSHDVRAAVRYPGESHVYAPALVAALEQACLRRGIRIVSGTGGTVDVRISPSSVEVETQRQGRHAAERLIVCTGAWSGAFERWFGLPIPVHPIRGQICAYPVPVGAVRHIVVSSQAYWTAKGNGTLVCGASEDVAGFDTAVTERGIGRLIRWGPRAFPMLADLPVTHRWAGLRPATRDGLPLIGKLADAPNVIVATGHYRNGILLSPVTAAAVGALLDDRHAPVRLTAFAPERFALAGVGLASGAHASAAGESRRGSA
jgi:glycine oxidase